MPRCTFHSQHLVVGAMLGKTLGMRYDLALASSGMSPAAATGLCYHHKAELSQMHLHRKNCSLYCNGGHRVNLHHIAFDLLDIGDL